MTREETVKIIRIMVDSYPNYKPNNISETVDVWCMMLDEYTYEQVAMGLKSYILSDKSGFAPAIGQIVDKIKTVSEPQQLNELEAWGLVDKAIRNSTYHAEEEFAKLPQIVQKAVGSPSQLFNWARSDIETLESVTQSNFLRTYRAVAKREDEVSRMPKKIRQLIQQNEPKIMIENNSTKILEDKQKNYVPMPDEVRARFEKIKG